MTISNSMTVGATLEFYTLLTLVDITATGVTRSTATNEHERNQHRNWETVLQTIGLTAQPIIVQGPTQITSELTGYEFGGMYHGTHNIWTMTFAVEHAEAFTEDNNPVGILERDFAQVPIITGLNETAKFLLPIFYTHGSIKNIYFITGQFDVNSI